MPDTIIKERPIIFSAPMVRAILEGRKTQTRRICKLNPAYVERWKHEPKDAWASECPYGKPGDRLWVRETWREIVDDDLGHLRGAYKASPETLRYYSEKHSDKQWRSPIHMPRWASRITLEITDVRVQRVKEISIQDVWAEGVQRCIYRHGAKPHIHLCDDGPDGCIEENGRRYVYPPVEAFGNLWNQINVKRAAWEENPLVWALTFRRVVTNA